MAIRLKRAQDPPAANDGDRVLVDRVWPRGIAKADLALDAWQRELAPSQQLRQWFGHDPARWAEFKRRYFAELDAHGGEALTALADRARRGRVTLVFAARDREHNNAVALKHYLQERLGA